MECFSKTFFLNGGGIAARYLFPTEKRLLRAHYSQLLLLRMPHSAPQLHTRTSTKTRKTSSVDAVLVNTTSQMSQSFGAL